MNPTRDQSIALGLAAGLAFVTEAVAELAHHQATHFASVSDYVVEALFGVALLLAAGALLGVREVAATTRRGRAATRVAAGGQAALALCSVATMVHGADALGPLFLLGLLGSVGGLLALTLTDPAARWIGAGLAVSFIVSAAVPHGGAGLVGLAWIAVVALLRAQRPALAPAGSVTAV